MYQGSRRALFPAALLVFGSYLLGLLVAAPKSPVATEEAAPAVSTRVPWEPLSRPSPELLHVSTLLSSGAKQKPQQRVQLEALSAAAKITTSLYRNPSAARVAIRSGRKRVA